MIISAPVYHDGNKKGRQVYLTALCSSGVPKGKYDKLLKLAKSGNDQFPA
jgi:hypothetical protein